MIGLEPFRQTLVGHYRRAGTTGSAAPASLELRGTRPRLLPGLGRSIAVEGALEATGLFDPQPVHGRITFDHWLPLAAAYDLDLCLPDGTRCRFHGARSRGLAGFLASASTISAELVDAEGRAIASFELRSDLRRALAGAWT